MEKEEDHKTDKRIIRDLSQMMKSDEITITEFESIVSENVLINPLRNLMNIKIPNLQMGQSQDSAEEVILMSNQIRFVNRAYVFTERYCIAKEIEFSLLDFERYFELQSEKTYQLLLDTVYKVFDNLQYNMRAHFFFISNFAILEVLKKELSQISPAELIKMSRPLFNDEKFIEKLYSFNDTELFQNEYSIYLKLLLTIKNPILSEAILPPLYGQLKDFTVDHETDNSYIIELHEEVTHQLRKDIAVSLDIIIPRTMKISLINNEIFFIDEKPWSRLASYGGFWLGCVNSFRVLSTEEKKEMKEATGEVKHISASLNLAMKFFWVFQLLGTINSLVPLSHATLWWYFGDSAK